MHVRELHDVGWGEGPWALATPLKPTRVVVGIYKENYYTTMDKPYGQVCVGQLKAHNITASEQARTREEGEGS